MEKDKYFNTIYRWLHETKSIKEYGKACADIQKAFSEAVYEYGYCVERDIYSAGVINGTADAIYDFENEQAEQEMD